MVEKHERIAPANSQEQKRHQLPLKFRLWPVINGPETAFWAIRSGIASAIWSLVLAAWVVLRMHFYDLAHIQAGPLFISLSLAPVVFAVLAVGLYRKSRQAALLGPVFFVVWLVAVFFVSPPAEISVSNLGYAGYIFLGIASISLLLGYVSGLRGILALNQVSDAGKGSEQ